MFTLYAYEDCVPAFGIIFTIEFVPSGAIQALSFLAQATRPHQATAILL